MQANVVEEQESANLSDDQEKRETLRSAAVNAKHAPKVVPENNKVMTRRTTQIDRTLLAAVERPSLEQRYVLRQPPPTFCNLLPRPIKDLPRNLWELLVQDTCSLSR